MAQPHPRTAASLANLHLKFVDCMPSWGLSHPFLHWNLVLGLPQRRNLPGSHLLLGFPARGTNHLAYSQLTGNHCWPVPETHPPPPERGESSGLRGIAMAEGEEACEFGWVTGPGSRLVGGGGAVFVL